MCFTVVRTEEDSRSGHMLVFENVFVILFRCNFMQKTWRMLKPKGSEPRMQCSKRRIRKKNRRRRGNQCASESRHLVSGGNHANGL